MVTQQVRAVKNVSRIGRIKKIIIRRENYKYLKQFCFVHWLDACRCRRCSAKQAGEPRPHPEHPRGEGGGEGVPPPKAGATVSKGSFATDVGRTPGTPVPLGTALGPVSAPNATCEGIPSPPDFSYGAGEGPAPPRRIPLQPSPHFAHRSGKDKSKTFFNAYSEKIPLFALAFFFFK